MDSFHTFVEVNMVPLIFAYGLAYFAAGLAIVLQQRQMSNFRLAHNLWLLGAFGIIHGVAEWGDIFIPIQSNHVSAEWITFLYEVQEVAWAVSFAFLLQFGVSMIAPRLPEVRGLQTFLKWYAPVWSLAVIVVALFMLPDEVSKGWVRYMLCFPAASLTAGAFLMERRKFVNSKSPSARANLTLAAIAFGVYAILGGLVVPEEGPPVLGWLNNANIHAITTMPIQFWRMLTGVAIAIFVIRTLSVFDLEFRTRLETAEREQALLKDRHRIARDLHDGVVQSIYSAGLQLEVAGLKAGRAGATEVHAQVRGVIEQLNRVISDIRKYIFKLGSVRTGETDIYEYLQKAADEFMASDNIDTTIEIEGDRVELSPATQQNLYFIVHESLSNVIRHAAASHVRLLMRFRDDSLLFQVEDDGVGIRPAETRQSGENGGSGLKSMGERATAMGASLSVMEGAAGGTLVRLIIPYDQKRTGKHA